MRWLRSEVDHVRLGCGYSDGGRVRWLGGVSLLMMLAGFVLVCAVGLVGAVGAAADPCPNAEFRTGASASLPDCRAYELVTPADKGRTQDLTFSNGSELAAVSGSGERLALQATVPFGPEPSVVGARAIFSRTPAGWEMKSVVVSGANSHRVAMSLFSPDLSHVALEWQTDLNFEASEGSHNITYEAGLVGGPFAPVATVPREYYAEFRGASADFGHVLFVSEDHALSLSGTERTAAEAADTGALDLYDWTGEHLQLVNVRQNGSLVNPCGAQLGGERTLGTNDFAAVGAVSEDGSRIFFTSPAPAERSSGPGCTEPPHLYMRVNGGEPVEVSAPEAGLTPPKILPVRYDYATPDGSKVFFNTEMALTSDDMSTANKLFEYNTEAPEGERLKLIASGVPISYGAGIEKGEGLFFSEDGLTVYIEPDTSGGSEEISRVDARTGKRSFVATSLSAHNPSTPSYSTPNGEFFLFTSGGVEGEPRGAGHDELYRYDNADESVMCVTCGVGYAPEAGEVITPTTVFYEDQDDTPALTPISENGQEVFFQTTARLVPQDTNSTETNASSTNGHPGLDVYEWEADGTGGCELSQGCTHLLSPGEASGPSTFLGASRNGSDVFFTTPARLVPQDADEFDDIYDARVDGGFAPPPPVLECLSCQGVGSPPPLFNVPASESFVGSGNTGHHLEEKRTPTKKRLKAKGGRRRRHGRKSKAAGRRGGSVRATGRGA
jgi:hypothetical protein